MVVIPETSSSHDRNRTQNTSIGDGLWSTYHIFLHHCSYHNPICSSYPIFIFHKLALPSPIFRLYIYIHTLIIHHILLYLKVSSLMMGVSPNHPCDLRISKKQYPEIPGDFHEFPMKFQASSHGRKTPWATPWALPRSLGLPRGLGAFKVKTNEKQWLKKNMTWKKI